MFLYYISYKRQHGPACVLARCGVQSCGILVALWPTCVVLSRYVSSPAATGLLTWRPAPPLEPYTVEGPSAGPAWSSLAQDLYGSGRHESGIRTVLSPGPWRAQHLYNADVDSRVWLASTRTYIRHQKNTVAIQ
jgi:hypothetical protein